MTYATGTVTDANPGPALYAAMEPTFLAAGFTLVDTVVIGSRTHKVLKSAAADNTFALDWYLDVHFPTTGAGSIFFTPFEHFDPATDLGYRGPYSVSSATIDGTTYSRYGATGNALETNWANSAAHTALDNPIVTSAFGWYLSATTERVIFLSTAASAELHYCGFFEPTAAHEAHAGADMYPLIVAHFSSPVTTPSSGSGATAISACLTRMPKVGSVNWINHVVCDISYAQMSGAVGGSGPFGGTGETALARRPIVMGHNALGSSSGTAAVAGLGLVGFLIDVGNSWTDGTIARGDTFTDDDSGVWVSTDDTSSVGMWFKAV
jgi:hypothetical protein